MAEINEEIMTANPNEDGEVNAFGVLEERIGKEEIQKARQTLEKYKQGKANLEKRIIENEQWYKQRHWEVMPDRKQMVEPVSAWLFNCIANKHADAMDNMPEPNILPREQNDRLEAQKLTSIVPVVLDQCDFEETYSKVNYKKLIGGTGIYGVFWDFEKLNGLGDISIDKIDPLNLFFEPGIADLQKSRHIFLTETVDNDELVDKYPQLNGKLGSKTISVQEYIYDDAVDTTNKSVVVDWYYHKNINGRKVLHYCKFVNDEVLFASENEPDMYETGWYAHGMYPFVTDPLFTVEGTPFGFGYIDIGKSAQEYIDRGNQAILQNMMVNAKPRFFIRSDGSVKEKEYADLNNDFVHVDGQLGQDSILPINHTGLSDIYVAILNNKVDELKETTGNRDISTGGSASGVTAASAIAAMQEAGSKLSRDSSKTSYRAYRKIIKMVIELIRQFYDMPRQFRIIGENGQQEFVQYSNEGIMPQPQGNDLGIDLGYRLPEFDIEVEAQKSSPYTKMSQNELALQFYSAGFFNPQMSDQALACVDMMDFPRKEFIMQKIAQNGTMFQTIQMMQQQMLAMAQIIDSYRGGNETQVDLMQQFGMEAPMAQTPEGFDNTEIKEVTGDAGESSTTRKARERVAQSTDPT